MRKSLLLFGYLIFLVACSNNNLEFQTQYDPNPHFASSGLLSINRIAPAVSSDSILLGFFPNHDKSIPSALPSLVIDLTKAKLSFNDSKGDVLTYPLNKDNLLHLNLKTGISEVKHKQTEPLWYANDQYFIDRNLSVPHENSRTRYLKGALGDHAVFIDSETPIFASLTQTSPVKGINIDQDLMKTIYNLVEVGSLIQIR